MAVIVQAHVVTHMALFTLDSKMPFGDPNTCRQPRHIAVHTCVYHASPADQLGSDFVDAYVPLARRSKGPVHSYYYVHNLASHVADGSVQQNSTPLPSVKTVDCHTTIKWQVKEHWRAVTTSCIDDLFSPCRERH